MGRRWDLWIQVATQSVAATSEDLCGSIGSSRGVMALTTGLYVSDISVSRVFDLH
jgi:hypothetical protein